MKKWILINKKNGDNNLIELSKLEEIGAQSYCAAYFAGSITLFNGTKKGEKSYYSICFDLGEKNFFVRGFSLEGQNEQLKKIMDFITDQDAQIFTIDELKGEEESHE